MSELGNAAARAADSELAPAPEYNLSGQRLGPKGRRTRQCIIDAGARLLEAGPDASLPLAAIAKESGVALTTIYEYFADFGALLLAILQPIRREMDGVVTLLNCSWPPGDEKACALRFVQAHLEYTRGYASALRLRNIFADSGDERFQRFRVESAAPIIAGLTRKIGGAQGAALAITLTLAVERAATVAAQQLYPQVIAQTTGAAFEGHSEALATLIALAMRH